MGCKKSYDQVIHYLSRSVRFGDSIAQIVCPRVFATLGRELDYSELGMGSPSELSLESDSSVIDELGLDMEGDIKMNDFSESQGPSIHEENDNVCIVKSLV